MERGLPGRWLTFLGDPGVGKTMLARQIFEQAKQSNPGRFSLWAPAHASGVLKDEDRRPCCIWLESTPFSQKLRAGDYELPDSYAPDWIVVFDDLGTTRDKSDFIADCVYRLATRRLGKWTVWTSNFALDEISERIDPRVTSRLVRDENTVVTIDAPDYALTGRKFP